MESHARKQLETALEAELAEKEFIETNTEETGLLQIKGSDDIYFYKIFHVSLFEFLRNKLGIYNTLGSQGL